MSVIGIINVVVGGINVIVECIISGNIDVGCRDVAGSAQRNNGAGSFCEIREGDGEQGQWNRFAHQFVFLLVLLGFHNEQAVIQ